MPETHTITFVPCRFADATHYTVGGIGGTLFPIECYAGAVHGYRADPLNHRREGLVITPLRATTALLPA